MTLLDLYTESSKKEDENLRVVSGQAKALLSGRPSAKIKNLRLRATTDPNGLLSDLGIETSQIKTRDVIPFLHSAFVQMVSFATGNKKARLLQDLFDEPEMVKSPVKGKKAVIIKLSPEGLKLAAKDSRKFLRTYAFWFQSTAEALSRRSTSGQEMMEFCKFQFLEAEQAIIVFRSRSSWSNL